MRAALFAVVLALLASCAPTPAESAQTALISFAETGAFTPAGVQTRQVELWLNHRRGTIDRLYARLSIDGSVTEERLWELVTPAVTQVRNWQGCRQGTEEAVPPGTIDHLLEEIFGPRQQPAPGPTWEVKRGMMTLRVQERGGQLDRKVTMLAPDGSTGTEITNGAISTKDTMPGWVSSWEGCAYVS